MQPDTNRHLDLGVFMPVANNGWIMSTAAPQYSPSHEMLQSIARRTEAADFEFLLAMTKFRGFGGKTHFWDEYLEGLVSMTALIADTSRLTLIASIGLPSLHPAVAARMIAAASLASHGRFGLNIVTGWNAAEYAQMGLWPGDWYYKARYDYATEYVTILRELWTTGRSSFKGEYFQLEDCYLAPQPTTNVPLVAAGMSDRGIAFTTGLADYQFTVGDLDSLTELVGQVNEKAAAAKRDVGVYAAINIIPGATASEARERAQLYLDNVDEEALMNLTVANNPVLPGASGSAGMAKNLESMPDLSPVTDDREDAALIGGAVLGGPTLVGSFEQIARALDRMSFEAKITGAMITVPDFEVDLDNFIEQVIPRMRSRQS